MNQQEILKKIGGIIAELKEQHNYLETSADSFNALELELFMANANFLTDHIEILKKIQGQAKPVALQPALPIEKTYLQRPEIPDYFTEEEHLVSAENADLFKVEEPVLTKKTEPELPEIPIAETIKHETFILPETMPQAKEVTLETAADTSFITQKTVTPETPVTNDVIIIEPENKPVVELKPEMLASPQSLQAEKFIIEPETVKPEPQPDYSH